VKVESLQPDPGPGIEEIDDGDGNPNTKSFLVKIADAGVVTVRAMPNPVVAEGNLPGRDIWGWGWTLTGGIGTSRLTRTVDRTTLGVTTITCVCGSSWKRTTIYVYEAKLKLYSRGDLTDFGHSWWKLEFSHPELLPFHLLAYVNEECGYWPQGEYSYWNPFVFVPGKVEIGDQGTAWATGDWRLTWSELRAGLWYTHILYMSPDDFCAWYHNCTDEAVTTGEAAGVETIDASANPTMPRELVEYLQTH
jgi:hypothetical protein